jgi:hypothetical protein
MANKKRRTPRSGFTKFPELRGKVVEAIEIDPSAESIFILFNDNTGLALDLDSRHVVAPELFRRVGKGDWVPVRAWKEIESPGKW